MVETMRAQGHTALVHTAAASNLGQMLNKICIKDSVGLVNIVRKREHVDILKKIGATHVCDSSSPTFMDDLTEALVTTGATVAFDAIGGGKLAGQILTAMEVAANRTAKEYSRYGSTTHKQVYIYGGLDRGPTEFNRTFGMAWGIGGWLLTLSCRRSDSRPPAAAGEGGGRDQDTFASTYTKEVSLAGALQLEEIAVYGKQATGEKYLINPNKGLPDRLQTRRDALVPGRAHPGIAILAGRELVRRDTGLHPVIALGMVDAQSVRKGEMSRGHRIVHRHRDGDAGPLRAEPGAPAVGYPEPGRVPGETRSAPP